VARLWPRLIPNRITVLKGFWNVSGIDSGRFRIFHLSVLWRASIARGVFRNFELTDTEAETLRTLILSRGAEPATSFLLTGRLLAFLNTGRVAHGMIMAPYWANSKRRIVEYAFGGCAWRCLMETPASDWSGGRRLMEDGTISLPICSLDDYRPALTFMATNAANWVSPLEL